MEDNGNICKDQSEFDGTYGLAVYNRTEQEKLEDEDSTFIEPKFAQVHTDKPIDEWIVSIAIEFNGQSFSKSDLTEETLEWLEWYNSLSPEEQLAVSSIPAELYTDDGAGTLDSNAEE